MAIKHTFVSAIEDGEDATLVRPSNWNASHTLDGGMVVPVVVLKTADETVNNSTTLQDDNHLVLAVGASDVWILDVLLGWSRESGGAQQSKYAFTVPVAATIIGHPGWSLTAQSAATDITSAQTLTGTMGTGTTWLHFTALYVGGANAGNIQLQWAQNTAEGFNHYLKANSRIIAVKLS